MRPPRALLRALCAALAVGAAARHALATDVSPPIPTNFQVSDCNGSFRSSGSTNINTASIRVQVQDSESGLRIGNTPLIAGATTRTDTVLFMDLEGNALDGSQTCSPTCKGNFNHGTVQGTPTFTGCTGPNGSYGTALCFDGAVTNDTTVNGLTVIGATNSVTNPNRLNTATPPNRLTIEAWVRLGSAAGPMPFVEFSTTARNGAMTGSYRPDGPSIWLNTRDRTAATAGAIYVNMVSSNTAPNPPGGIADNVVFTDAGKLPADANFHLLAVTYDATTPGPVSIYVDGVMVASRAIGAIANLRINSLMDFRIGYSTTTPQAPTGFNGRIDQLRVLRRSLSSTELLRNFAGSQVRITRPGSAMIAYGFTNQITDAVKTLQTNTKTFSNAAGDTLVNPVMTLGNNTIEYVFQDKAGNATVMTNQVNFNPTAPAPPTISAFTALTDTSIQYSWNQPADICTGAGPTVPQYNVYDCSDSAIVGSQGLTATTNTETVAGPNVRHGRKVSAKDMVLGGLEGLKSACSEAYTRARQPSSLVATEVTTSTMRLTWGINSNPTYTRYELALYNDTLPGCTPTPCTQLLVPIGENYTLNTVKLTGLAPGETYTFSVRAFNGDANDVSVPGQHFTGYTVVTQATIVSATTLRVSANNDADTLAWSWDPVYGAATYTLRDESASVLCGPVGATTCNTGPHGPNVPIRARVTATGSAGDGEPSNFARAFTGARAPTNFRVRAGSISSNTVTLDWDLNGNPIYTNFEIRRATNSAMSGVISTNTYGGTSTEVRDLLPLTSFYFQIRSINGDDLRSAADTNIPEVFTLGSANVTSSTGPYTTYEIPAGAVGIWHFDEGSGTTAIDATGKGHNGRLLCDFNRCISTPTYSAGPEGLGTALRTTGQADSYVAVATSTQWDPGGATGLTVEAWVNPAQSLQTPEAAIIAKGSSTLPADDFAFALDVYYVAGISRWRFRVGDGTTVSALNTAALLDPGNWHHLAGVWLPGSSEMRFYVDGVFVSSASAITTRQAGGRATIGSRPVNGTSSYNAGFNGLIDEVKVLNRPLSASEVEAEVAAGLPGLYIPTSGNADVRLTIPANAFGGGVKLFVSSDPEQNPLRVARTDLIAALAAPPTGLTFVPDSLIEIVATVNGLPYTGTLGSSVTISVSYPDADSNGLIDGTFPPIEASRLVMHALKNQVPEWEPLTTTVDKVNRRVLGRTPHFSVFALFGPSGIGANLSELVVFPVPWKPGSGGKFDSASFNGRLGLRFDRLPTEGVIKIYAFSGEAVVEIPFAAVDAGTVIWDGRNQAGRNVASGIYFARVRSAAGGATLLKFAIER